MNIYHKISGVGIILVLLFFLGPCVFRGCVPTPPHMPKKEIQVAEGKITEEDKKVLPDVSKKLIYKPSKPQIGHRVETSILQGVTRTVVIEEQRIDWGFKNRLGLFGAAEISGLDAGLSWTTLYWWRINLDVLAGTKSSGVGLSYQVFQNTSTGMSYGYSYSTLLPNPSVYVALGF